MNGKREISGKTMDRPLQDDHHPFGCHWLDGCYQQTTLPGSPWHQVHELILSSLAKHVSQQLGNAQRAEMILHLMGPEFRRLYFPNVNMDPTLLEPPAMDVAERINLQQDVMRWLQATLTRACEDTKCLRPYESDSGTAISSEMRTFREHTEQVVAAGLHRELLKMEKNMLNEIQSSAWQQYEATQQQYQHQLSRRQEEQRQTGAAVHLADVKGILKGVGSQSSGLSSAQSRTLPVRPDTQALKASMAGPQLWGLQSEQLGKHVISILHRDPRRFSAVAKGLLGRQLPPTLRRYIWLDTLLHKERQNSKASHIERLLRERFAKTVMRGMAELGIKRANHSPISNLIDNAVIEKYDTTPSMHSYLHDNGHQKETCRVLNVLYTYDRSYEPYIIYWLFPLQLTFQEQQNQGTQVYELAMYLSLLSRSCFPGWPAVYAAAERGMLRLTEADAELVQHLTTIAQIDPQVNYKDFLVEAVHQEKKRALEILQRQSDLQNDLHNAQSGSLRQARSDSPLELLTDPVVFLRKWIGECFVSILDTNAVLWVWDQFFLTRWDTVTMEILCVALVELLRYHFLEARNYTQMKQVFLQAPAKLYTLDIQHAWVHLKQGGSPGEVPALNRHARRPEGIDAQPMIPVKPDTPQSQIFLPSLGLRQLQVELVFSPTAFTQHKWIKDFKAANIHIKCEIYFGSVKLTSQATQSGPQRSSKTSSKGNTIHTLSFTKEKLVFDRLNVSHLDVEPEIGGQPWAVLHVVYSRPEHEGGAVTLGWTRVQVCQSDQPSPGTGIDWSIKLVHDRYALIPGFAPEGATVPDSQDVLKSTPSDGVLGDGSAMVLEVYDPLQARKTPTPLPRTPSAAHPSPSMTHDVNSCFDFYIDKVANLPDNGTIVKVTGRLLHTGHISSVPDLLAYPELDESARSPLFKYRLMVNKEQLKADTKMLAFLRVYTVDKDRRNLVVVGSCLVPCFTEKGKLLVGGHEYSLYSGKPNPKQAVSTITADALNQYPRIPACRLYIRMLIHSLNPIEAPTDREYYSCKGPPLSASELRIIQSHTEDRSYPATIKHMAQTLQDKKINDTDMADWICERLDNKKQLTGNSTAGDLDLARLVRYRPPVGVALQITRLYGMPAGVYIQCFARICPKSLGPDQKFITQKHDYSSRQTAPAWTDPPKTLHVGEEDGRHTVLLVQVFGLKVAYKPDPSHRSPGQVTNAKGGELALSEDTVLGWAAVPLINRGYVLAGEHHVPLFRGRPDAAMTKALTESPVSKAIQNHSDVLSNAAVVVNVWDAHYDPQHLPHPLQKNIDLLTVIGSPVPYEEAESNQSGPQLSQFVVDSLEKKSRKQGTRSAIYDTEKEFYSKTMEQKFYSLMESALMETGYGPL